MKEAGAAVAGTGRSRAWVGGASGRAQLRARPESASDEEREPRDGEGQRHLRKPWMVPEWPRRANHPQISQMPVAAHDSKGDLPAAAWAPVRNRRIRAPIR